MRRSTDSNSTPGLLRRVVKAIADHIVGAGVILGAIGAITTFLVLLRLDHSVAPQAKNAVGAEGSIYAGVGVVAAGILVLFVAYHRTIRAYRGLIGGAGVLLIVSAVFFLLDLGHLPGSARRNRPGPSVRAETSHSHHRSPGPSHKGKQSQGSSPSGTESKAPVDIISTPLVSLAHSASHQSGCGCGYSGYYTKDEGSSTSGSEAEQPSSETETSPSTSTGTSSTPTSAGAATTPTTTTPLQEAGGASGESDSGVGDTGTDDVGNYDEGSNDKGNHDSGSNDVGNYDTGNYDVGNNDLGEHDIGNNDTGNYEVGNNE